MTDLACRTGIIFLCLFQASGGNSRVRQVRRVSHMTHALRSPRACLYLPEKGNKITPVLQVMSDFGNDYVSNFHVYPLDSGLEFS